MTTNILEFSPQEAVLLERIPGLHMHGLHATGSDDAIAAAELVLGRGPPQGPKGMFIRRGLCIPGARSYQEEGIEWLAYTLHRYGGAILSDEMGLGKTFQTINLIKQVRPAGRVLVLCPGSVRETWREELIKWDLGDVVVIYPGTSKAKWASAAEAQVVVTSHHYSSVEAVLDNAFRQTMPHFLVLDEAHRFRGRKTKRQDVMRDLAALVPNKIALTGTPQWNSMRDWWSLLNILFPNKFGNKWNFDLRYAGAVPGSFGGLDYPRIEDGIMTPAIIKRLHLEELRLRLSFYMLGRTKAEVAPQMPPMTVQVRWVDATPQALTAFRKVQMGLKSSRSESAVHQAIMATLPGKVEEVLAIAAEAQRFVLTTWTNEGAAELHRYLNAEGVPCILATASMSGPRRSAAIQDAIRRRCGLVATTDLFAEGLNLQKVASVGILHALDFVPRKIQQLFGRLHRIDITEPVIWHVVAMRDSIDKYIMETGAFKLDASAIKNASSEQVRTALTPRDTKQSTIAALAKLYSLMETGDHNEEDDRS